MVGDKGIAKVEEAYGKVCNSVYTVTILVLFHLWRAASGGSLCEIGDLMLDVIQTQKTAAELKSF